MRIGRIFLALTFLVACLPAFSLPQDTAPAEGDEVPRIEETVIVTASCREVPLEWAGSAVTVLTREDLARKGCRTVTEALASVPGLQVNSTGAGGASTVMIRGAQSEQTVVMVDGVELNDPMTPGRGFEFGLLTLDNVDRIEVVRGPQSMVHGSDAMGGIVNIITRPGGGKGLYTAQVEGGRFTWFQARVEAAGEAAGFRYAAGASREQLSGWSAAGESFGNHETDGQGVSSLNARLSRALGRGFETAFAVHGNRYRQDLDAFGGAFGDDPNYRAEGRELALSGELRHTPGTGVFSHRASFSYLDTRREYLDPEDSDHVGSSSEALYRGIRKKFRWQGDLSRFRNHYLSFGYEYSREQGHSRYASEGPWGPYTADFADQAAGLQGLFVEDRFQWGSHFSVTGGARVDHHDRFGAHASFRVSPVLVIPGPGTRVRFSVGTGFKAPSLYQLYAPPSDWGSVGNPDLAPETSWSIDGGIVQDFQAGRAQFSAGFFLNRFDHLIDFVDGYQNVGKARTRGIELEAKWAARDNLTLGGSYTFTDAVNLATDEELLRRARHTAAVSVECRPARHWFVAAEGLLRGARWDMDYTAWPAARVMLDPRAVLNLSVSRRVGEHAELYVRLDNLFNNSRPDVYGYTPEPFMVRAGLRLVLDRGGARTGPGTAAAAAGPGLPLSRSGQGVSEERASSGHAPAGSIQP
ncbi:MAG: TonB-dependent receptor [Acidobacteria bacterium]|nr:TonB-dependent receptor [Acidobacteriota bacterium]